MRLSILENGQGFLGKLKLGVIGLVSGGPAPDVVRTLLYRPEFFGKPYGIVTHHALRESKHWSKAECELFAAFVSSQNQCPF